MKAVSFIKKILLFSVIFGLAQSKLNANPIPSGSALTIVAPVTITQPGNYRLGNDISGTIVIAADNVELDFENNTVTAGANGISITNQENVVIKNGVITDASTNGVLIDTCTNICIENITFLDGLVGVNVMTTTELKIQNCTFKGHTSEVLNLVDVSLGLISDCLFSFNVGANIILGSDCNCMVFENLDMCENTNTNANVTEVFLTNFLDTTILNCHIDENVAQIGNFIGWLFSGGVNTTLKQCTSNSNRSVATFSLVNGYSLFACTNVVFESCQSNRNSANATNNNFLFQTGSTGITLSFCEANGNSLDSVDGSVLNGYSVTSAAQEIIFKHCTAVDNNTVSGDITGFLLSTTDNCLIKCLAKANVSTNDDVRGFRADTTSDQNLFEDCIAKSNSGGGLSIGFANDGINNVFIRNLAQDHGVMGAGNYSGVPTPFITTLDPSTDWTSTVTPFNNISVTLP